MFVGENQPKDRARSALLTGSSCLELGYGRFMQTDPLGYDDGLNWYNYVASDPINNVDPTGTSCFTIEVDPTFNAETHEVTSGYRQTICLNDGGGNGGGNPSGGGGGAGGVRQPQKAQCSDPLVCKSVPPPQPACNVTNNFCGPVPKATPSLTPKQLHDQACKNYALVGRFATYGGGAGLIVSLATKANPYTAAASGALTVVGVGAQAAADLSGC